MELLGEKKDHKMKKKSVIQKRERKYLYVCRGVSVCMYVCLFVCVIKVVGHAATLKQKQQHVGRE